MISLSQRWYQSNMNQCEVLTPFSWTVHGAVHDGRGCSPELEAAEEVRWCWVRVGQRYHSAPGRHECHPCSTVAVSPTAGAGTSYHLVEGAPGGIGRPGTFLYLVSQAPSACQAAPAGAPCRCLPMPAADTRKQPECMKKSMLPRWDEVHIWAQPQRYTPPRPTVTPHLYVSRPPAGVRGSLPAD